jgi:hypothetical protein
LPVHCCQPAVAGGIIYADLWGELSTHLAPQALFVQSSPVWESLLQAFPFPSTGKGDTAPALSGLSVYLQFMWEVGLAPSPVKFSSHCHFHKLFCSCLLGGAAAPASRHVCLQFMWEVGLPSSPVEFSSLCHSHKLPCSWLLGACPAPTPTRASAARPACLFTILGRIPFPQSSALRAPHPLSCMSYLFLLLITQFLFFSLGGGQTVQVAILLWPRLVCGSTMVPRSSPGLPLPKPSGRRQLAAQGPSWFLCLT